MRTSPTSPTLLVAAAGALLLSAAPPAVLPASWAGRWAGSGSAAAQEREAAAERGSEGRRGGWIGVGLREIDPCAGETGRDGGGVGMRAAAGERGCRPVHVVETVVVDGPADRAGVQPGDTLVSLAGVELAGEGGPRRVPAFGAGEEVEVRLARPGRGRRTLTVEAATRPDDLSRLPVRMRSAGIAGTWRFRLETGGDEVRLREVSEALLRTRGELARRMAAIRDSVLREARVHLDSLSEHRLVGMIGPEGRPPLIVRFARGEDVRAAGGEFRTLVPELAEYFRGAESGMLVLRVLPGTPAAELGLRPGDVVVEAAGREVRGPADLREALRAYPRQDSLVVKWIRKGEERVGVLR